MDPLRNRILADLGGLLKGEVRCDDLFLQMYASDASIYQISPTAVVRPKSVDDVVAVVQYAAENQLTIHPRGAGSSVTGASLGNGIVLDFSVHMRRILEVNDNVVRVQPGAVLNQLNLQLSKNGRLFGPDPATRSVTTVGGVLSTNATGSHWPRYGSPREKVLSLQVVWADGTVAELDSRANANFDRTYRQSTHHQSVANLVGRHARVIDEHRSQTRLDQSGYYLESLLQDSKVDLTRLLVGSEGTLGLITEAKLLTEARPAVRGVVLLFFESIEKATHAISEISAFDPAACDMMDRRLLTLAREIDSRYERVAPPEAEAMLLVEFDGNELASIQQKMQGVIQRLTKRRKLAFEYRETTQADERDLFWRLARRVIPVLYRLRGDARALPFIEDIAIAPERLTEFISRIHDVLNRHEVTASIFSHALQGHVDIRPFLDIANPAHVDKMKSLACDVFDTAISLGGTISGGMGDGLSRTWYLRTQSGSLADVFRDVKRSFDPDFRLNPGKIVNFPFSDLTENLRPVGVGQSFRRAVTQQTVGSNEGLEPAVAPHAVVAAGENGLPTGAAEADASDAAAEVASRQNRPDKKSKKPRVELPLFQPQLEWDVDEMAQMARTCNGCGRCRTQGRIERMCPIFRLLPAEEATPRAKANLVRSVLNGQIEFSRLASEDMKLVADLCVNCHQCRVECPASVDIPKLVTELKAQYVSQSGMALSQWVLSRLDLLYSIGANFPAFSNWAIGNRFVRWFLDRAFGIAQGRKLPRFSFRSFYSWAHRQQIAVNARKVGRGSASAKKVAYFVDGLATWNDTEIGKALVRVLEHNGVEVIVPLGQRTSGMNLITEGLVQRARKEAARNVEVLADVVRQGYRIVTTEPSATMALTHEYRHLLDDTDVELVAENTMDASAYLWGLHCQGQLELNFQPVNAMVAYHTPCHLRAIYDHTPAVSLLKLVPGLQVQLIEKGCSGMAGIYGLRRKNYRRSLRAGVELINSLRAPEIVAGVTDCGPCKIQMEHGTVKPTIHPIKILALAYGLLPQLSDLLNRRSGERVLS